MIASINFVAVRGLASTEINLSGGLTVVMTLHATSAQFAAPTTLVSRLGNEVPAAILRLHIVSVGTAPCAW